VWDMAYRLKRKAKGRPVIPGKMRPEKYKAYKAWYNARPDIKKRAAEKMREYVKLPHVVPKEKARRAVRAALRIGSLKKQPCHCGETKVEGHHPDYSKPLEVVWLCRAHHEDVHHKKHAEEIGGEL